MIESNLLMLSFSYTEWPWSLSASTLRIWPTEGTVGLTLKLYSIKKSYKYQSPSPFFSGLAALAGGVLVPVS